jgi:ABC-type transport system substrate-binding protein
VEPPGEGRQHAGLPESPFKHVAEVVGSGPYRFLKDEHVSGARAVFERFAEYQPRAGGSVGFTAGPKVAHIERVEWLTLDPASASAALRRGEIEWWEVSPRDLVDQVRGDPNITVVSHFATANGIMTFNQRYPPFDNPAIRRALLGAVDQAEAMSAIAGSCPEQLAGRRRSVRHRFGVRHRCRRRGAAQPARLCCRQAGPGGGPATRVRKSL